MILVEAQNFKQSFQCELQNEEKEKSVPGSAGNTAFPQGKPVV